ncbi:MAG TPA: hypothetical protein VIV55_01955 [Flavobacterium sp.]
MRIDTNDVNITLRDMPTNWGEGVWLYNGELFTGIMYEYFPMTNQLCSEVELKEGIIDGRQVEYYPNGQIKEEYFEKYAAFYGSFKSWDEHGVLIMHQEYDDFGNLIKKII